MPAATPRMVKSERIRWRLKFFQASDRMLIILLALHVVEEVSGVHELAFF